MPALLLTSSVPVDAAGAVLLVGRRLFFRLVLRFRFGVGVGVGLRFARCLAFCSSSCRDLLASVPFCA